MQPLEKSLRGTLERTVKEARDVADSAAKAALNHLGVMDTTPPSHLDEEERVLRRRLRAHGRQLGDMLNGGKVRTMDRLIEEVAYEHWHRMLFARFLAENNLLMFPDPEAPVAVTLEECEDLAAEEGAANGWELAARFASRMLPQIFRLDSPVFQLVLPPEHQQALERLVADLPAEVFTASDSLGWVYQFWQAKRKDEVNDSEVKIGARELPAVTQLFTEPYMVSFLLDNSLGAWWAARRLSEEDLRRARNEEELRRKASIPGVPLEYLRFVQVEDGVWAPAAGTFDKWPENLSELKTLDPCCGSGHFLVAAFLMLVPMRMELEGLSAKDAVDAVLRENIHGLELDQRCVELAVFALAIVAWGFSASSAYRSLPRFNIACSGLSVSATKDEWLKITEDKNLKIAIGRLYDQFINAHLLGSLVNPGRSLEEISILGISWGQLEESVGQLLSKTNDDEKLEIGTTAKGLATTARLLQQSYDLIITNVPFRQSDSLDSDIYGFLKANYPLSKSDIATAFHERLQFLLKEIRGTMAIVMPQGFLYKDYYSRYRKQFFQRSSVTLLARIGANGFEEIGGEEVKVFLSICKRKAPTDFSLLHQIDVSTYLLEEKKKQLQQVPVGMTLQKNSLTSSKNIVVKSNEAASRGLLEDYASFSNGIQTGDYPRFGRCFWEISTIDNSIELQLSTVKETIPFGGREQCVIWGKNNELYNFIEEKVGEGKAGSWIRGTSCKGKKGIAISAMGELKATLYCGEIFDDNTVVIIPKEDELLEQIWSFCSSRDYNRVVREVDQSNKVRGALLRVPFDPNLVTPSGIPGIHSDHPSQWIFHGHPCGSVIWDENKKWTSHGPLRTDETVLQIAVARLLGYRWPAELDEDMELAEEQREWVKRCDALLPYADEDGIVCIPPVRGETSAADRLLTLLAAAYGDAWASDTLSQLLQNADHAGKSLETWLRDKFFIQHCKLFQHRPFIWHIWDGLRDGFSVLVNYHKLDYKTLETLIYTYLGDWISRQRDDINSGVDGAAERLAAAEQLKKKLELILKGEAPHDIFVRWKPIEEQPVGWNPDLNDGARLNIRPFMTVGDIKKKGAGILREKPNINWNKDRGKDVESAPWYHLFNGDRINDHHLSLAEKQAARKVKESSS